MSKPRKQAKEHPLLAEARRVLAHAITHGRDGFPAKNPVHSTSSCPMRRSGLSDPNRSIDSCHVIFGNGRASSMLFTFCQISQ